MKNVFKSSHAVCQTCAAAPENGSMLNGASQPPKNRIAVIALTRTMLAYSPIKNRRNVIDEYSTKYPATSSDSPSGKSNGARLVSASPEMKKITAIGRSGMTYQTCRCASTMSERFKEPAQSSTVTRTKPIETSYDTICAAERSAPKKA